MNYTAKKLREAAEYIGDGETCSDTAIVTVREMFDVGRADTFGGDLGRVLVAIADELDKLQTKANEANNLRQQLESAEDKAERRKRHIGYLDTALHDKNVLFKQRGEALAKVTEENAELRKQVPSERERQILDMWPKFEDGAYVWLGDRFGDNKGEPRKIEGITLYSHGIDLYDDEGFHKPLDHGERLKLPVQSVLDADGVEIKVGDTVWTLDGLEGVVTKVEDGAAYIAYESDYAQCEEAANLTHTRPDSWERLEEDVNAIVTGDGLYHRLNNYCSARDLGGDDVMRLTIGDIVRRAKALAGIEVD